MKEAFLYMFKDTAFQKKAVAYFTICFLSSALFGYSEVLSSYSFANTIAVTSVKGCIPLLLQLLGGLLYLIVCGYYLNCVSAIVKQQANIVLPLLNIKNSLIKGVRFYISIFLIALIIGIIGILTYFTNEVFNICIGVLLLILLGIFTLAFTWIFAVENRLTAFLSWTKAIAFIKRNYKTYFINYLLVIALFLVGAFVSYFVTYIFNFVFDNIFISYILSTIFDALILMYTAFVCMYLVAKSIKPFDLAI